VTTLLHDFKTINKIIKKIIKTILRILLGLFWTAQGAYGQNSLLSSPPIQAAAAIVVDGNTGATLWAKNPDRRLPPASTTKIVTGLLLARDVPPDQPVIASPNAAQTPGHALGMRPGETFRARDLLYAILLASANDASVAAAEHIARKESAFADRMSQFARQNHAPNTRFANASGLPASGHYSTARDLAALAHAALQNPDFAAAVRTRAYALPRSGGRPATQLVNENTLLGTVPGMDGVKAGWTHEAGACFVGSATRSGRRIITVVLNSPDWQRETAALVEYGFASLKTQGEKQGVGARQAAPGSVRAIPNTAFVAPGSTHAAPNSAPALKGNTLPGINGGAKNNGGVMNNAGAINRAPAETASGTNVVPGVPKVPNAPSGSSAPYVEAGRNRQTKAYIPTAPQSQSSPESGPNFMPDWNTPASPLSARDASFAPSGPFANRPGSARHESDRHGRRGANDRAPLSPSSYAPPATSHSFLLYLIFGGIVLLAAALLLTRKWKFTMPELPFGLFGRRRKSESPARPPVAELAAPPIKRTITLPLAAPAFTFSAPLLERLAGPDWLESVLDTPTRLLEHAARRQACAIRDTDPRAGDLKIRQLLHAPGGRTRAVAAELLITHAPRQSEETLLGLLKDEHMSAEVRADAVHLLAQTGGDRHERLWLQMLLRDGSPSAAHALARLPRLENATVQTLRNVVTTGGEARESDGELKRNLRTAQIASVLLAQGYLTRPDASPFLNALPANHGEPILVATLRGSQQKDAVECLVEIVLHGHAYPALQSLLETDPRIIRQILDPLWPTLDLTAQTRATILKWLVLGEGNDDTLQELVVAGNDLARGAQQLGRTHRWQPGTVPPDALLAAAQIYSLRLGFSLHAQEDIAYAFRKAATDGEARSLAALPPELQPLAEAYAHPDVYEAVQAAMHTNDGLPALLATLARHPENRAYRQEMAFWCDKLPGTTRLLLTHALCASEEAADDETTRSAIADRAADPDALVRSVALRWLHAHPEQPKPEE
jgi:D-alanyl-D-alanine carboxypeptidase